MSAHINPHHKESANQCSLYARKNGFSIGRMLGWGAQGIAFETSTGSVVKGLLRKEEYARERNVYMRLSQHDVTEVLGFTVPRLIGHDDALFVIEMGFVAPPCVIDFASAELDSPTEFPEDMMGPWREKEREAFGDKVSEARRISRAFEKRYGIFLSDLNPGNIIFPRG